MDLPPSPQPTRSRIWFSSFIFFVSIFKINNKWINKRLIDCISRLSVCLSVCLSDSLTSLLRDWLNYWPTYWSLMTNWLTDCVTDWLTVLLTALPTDQSTVLLTYSLSYWLTFGLKGCLTDWPSYWLIDWLTDWLPSCDTIFTFSQNDLLWFKVELNRSLTIDRHPMLLDQCTDNGCLLQFKTSNDHINEKSPKNVSFSPT